MLLMICRPIITQKFENNEYYGIQKIVFLDFPIYQNGDQ